MLCWDDEYKQCTIEMTRDQMATFLCDAEMPWRQWHADKYVGMINKWTQVHNELPLIKTLVPPLPFLLMLREIMPESFHDEMRMLILAYSKTCEIEMVVWAVSHANIKGVDRNSMFCEALVHGRYDIMLYVIRLMDLDAFTDAYAAAFNKTLKLASARTLHTHKASLHTFEAMMSRSIEANVLAEALIVAADKNDLEKVTFLFVHAPFLAETDDIFLAAVTEANIEPATVQKLFDLGFASNIRPGQQVLCRKISVVLKLRELGLFRGKNRLMNASIPRAFNHPTAQNIETEVLPFLGAMLKQFKPLYNDMLFNSLIMNYTQDTRLLEALKEHDYEFNGKIYEFHRFDGQAIACYEFCEQEGMIMNRVNPRIFMREFNDDSAPAMRWLVERDLLSVTPDHLDTALARDCVRVCNVILELKPEFLQGQCGLLAMKKLYASECVTEATMTWLLDVRSRNGFHYPFDDHISFFDLIMAARSLKVMKHIHAIHDGPRDHCLLIQFGIIMRDLKVLEWMCDTFPPSEDDFEDLRDDQVRYASNDTLHTRLGYIYLESRYPNKFDPLFRAIEANREAASLDVLKRHRLLLWK